MVNKTFLPRTLTRESNVNLLDPTARTGFPKFSDRPVAHQDMTDTNATCFHQPEGIPIDAANISTEDRDDCDENDNNSDSNHDGGTLTNDLDMRELTRVELEMRQELRMLIGARVDTGSILLLCSASRRARATRSLNTDLETRLSIKHPTGLVWPFSLPDMRMLRSHQLAKVITNPRPKIVCIGLPLLTRSDNMGKWLGDSKKLLTPRGTLVVQLQWDLADRTWRDVATRYADVAAQHGFKLDLVNGCSSDESDPMSRVRFVSNLRNLANRLKHVPNDTFATLRHLLKQYAHQCAQDQSATTELFEQGTDLYGAFVLSGDSAKCPSLKRLAGEE